MTEKAYAEFNGLPGCGKSTICREMEKLLEGRMPVVMLSERKAAEPKGLARFLRQVLSGLVHGQAGMIRDMLLFALKLPKGTPKRFICFYSSARDYLLTLKCMRETESGILLSDQGVLQHFLSGFYNQERVTGMKEARRIMRRAERDFAPFLEINLLLAPDKSLERMNGRKEKASRLERLSGVEATRLMTVQDATLRELRKALCSPERTLDADARKSPQENAEIILDRILKGTMTSA